MTFETARTHTSRPARALALVGLALVAWPTSQAEAANVRLRVMGTVDWTSGDCSTTSIPYGMQLAVIYDTERSISFGGPGGRGGEFVGYEDVDPGFCAETSASLPIDIIRTTLYRLDDTQAWPFNTTSDALVIIAAGEVGSLTVGLGSNDLSLYSDTSLPESLALASFDLQASWELVRGTCRYGGAIDTVETRAALACGVPDADNDAVRDEDDVCLGDDTIDLDDDSVPDDCDVCPGDLLNDQDGDGLCTADDMCPNDFDDDGGGDDLDGDAVCNSDDVCPDGDDFADADGDRMADACDLCPADADNDADGDGICGDVDICFGDDTVDADGDGLGDACDLLCPDDPTNDADFDGVCGLSDPCPYDELDDSDGDGSCDSADVCPDSDDFSDLDGDSQVDCRDTCPFDVENDGDGDGICEFTDNCSATSNPDQLDADVDGTGDACESDGDGDGVVDDIDNCPLDVNPGQADGDGDGNGDACDGDGDADGVADGADKCPATPYGAIVSPFGCSVPDICPETSTWKTHWAYVRCVTAAANHLVSIHAMTPAQRCVLVDAATASTIGG